MITQKELKELLRYNPDTGVFTWINNMNQKAMSGDVAGHIESNGYSRVMVNQKRYMTHRLAWFYMTGKWPKNEIDHIDHNPSNNAFFNLREATPSANKRNKSKSKNNTSGVTGVYWAKLQSKWFAQIKLNNKSTCFGYFTDKFEAICARKSAENKHGFHTNHGK